MHGPLSKYGFAKGLAETISLVGKIRLPDIRKPWEYTYFNWLQVRSLAQSLLEHRLSLQGGHSFDRAHFSCLCPACYFNDVVESTEDTRNVCIIAVDGNFQHKRFKDLIPSVQKKIVSATFVSHPDPGSEYDFRDIASKGCGHSFVAADAAKPKSMDRLDETGLMGATCRHGQPLRYISTFGGERYGVTAYLLQQVVDACPQNADLYLLYDIACMFEPSIQKRLPGLSNQFKAMAIPAFHVFGHRVSCQVLHGPLQCVGIGQSDGETCERDWAQKRHLVATCRRSSARHRTLLLDSQSLHFALVQRQKLFSELQRRLNRATISDKNFSEELRTLRPQIRSLLPGVSDMAIKQKALQDGAGQAQLDEEENELAVDVDEAVRVIVDAALYNQIRERRDYFTTTDRPSLPFEELFKAIKREREFLDHINKQKVLYDTYQTDEDRRVFQNRTLASSQEELKVRQQNVNDLLEKFHQLREHWDPNQSRWQNYSQLEIWQKLDDTLAIIMREVVSREQVLRTMHSRISGQKEARKFLSSLHHSTPKIASLTKKWNEYASELPEDRRPQPLDKDNLTVETLRQAQVVFVHYVEKTGEREGPHSFRRNTNEHDGHDKNQCSEKTEFPWTHSSIALAMDVLQKRDRAKEEVALVGRELKRLGSWLVQRAQALRLARRCVIVGTNALYFQDLNLDCLLMLENALSIKSEALLPESYLNIQGWWINKKSVYHASNINSR